MNNTPPIKCDICNENQSNVKVEFTFQLHLLHDPIQFAYHIMEMGKKIDQLKKSLKQKDIDIKH